MESLKTVTATVMTVCFWWIGRMAVWHKIETHEGWTQPGIFNQIWMHSSQQSTTPNSMKQLSQTIAFNLAKSGQCFVFKKKKLNFEFQDFQALLVGVDTSHLPWPTPSHGSFQGVQRLAPPAERVPSSIRRQSSLWAAPSRHPTRRRTSPLASRGTRGFFGLEKNNTGHQESQVGMVCVFLLGLGGFRMMILIGSLRSFKKWVSESQFSSF